MVQLFTGRAVEAGYRLTLTICMQEALEDKLRLFEMCMWAPKWQDESRMGQAQVGPVQEADGLRGALMNSQVEMF